MADKTLQALGQALTAVDVSGNGSRYAVGIATPSGGSVTINTASGSPITSTPRKGTVVGSVVSGTTNAGVLLAANANRVSAIFYNNGSSIAFIGTGSGVTSSTGFPIPANGVFTDDASTGAWYVITASGTADMRVLESS